MCNFQTKNKGKRDKETSQIHQSMRTQYQMMPLLLEERCILWLLAAIFTKEALPRIHGNNCALCDEYHMCVCAA